MKYNKEILWMKDDYYCYICCCCCCNCLLSADLLYIDWILSHKTYIMLMIIQWLWNGLMHSIVLCWILIAIAEIVIVAQHNILSVCILIVNQFCFGCRVCLSSAYTNNESDSAKWRFSRCKFTILLVSRLFVCGCIVTILLHLKYFAASRGAKYCNQHICMSLFCPLT